MYKQVNNENEIELERQSLLKLIEGKNYISKLICTEKTRKFSLEWINFSKRPDVTLRQALDWSSQEEHRADALALGAEEGRDKLR